MDEDDDEEPQPEDSLDFENEEAAADYFEGEQQVDDVEGTKNFDKAYDKLIKKFYNEEGANLLIPQEDMIMHEYNKQNRVKVDVEEQ